MTDQIEQGTPEWFQQRLGKVTASKLSDVMSKGRGSAPSATRATYMAQLVAERLSGKPTDSFTNAAMDWGTETEPQARAAYTMYTGNMVDQVGFVEHPLIEDSGASPDGEVGSDGLVEIKCPLTKTHIASLKSRTAPAAYMKQIQWQLACTGRAWCDFVSFDPRMPPGMQIMVDRIYRDDAAIREMESAVTIFLSEVQAECTHLEQIYGGAK